MSDLFRSERLENIGRYVNSANVVFFVGAGFSRDSEGNTADRLVRRLAARILGMCKVLSAGPRGSEAAQILTTFKAVHGLGDIEECSADFVGELSRNYYPFNDWCVSALADLADILCSTGTSTVVRAIHAEENSWLNAIGILAGRRGKWPLDRDKAPMRPIDLVLLRKFRSTHGKTVPGKIMFLEAMGFSCPDIMSGDLSQASPKEVARSFQGRLRRRHHVLARLAREGLSPILLTTNFDLLIEGAYRLAGFREWSGAPSAASAWEPPTRHPYFARIAAASDFFEKRDGGRVASIVKIHGCADAFRAAMRRRKAPPMEALLRSIVFTYREVQNWRQDSWSRDLVYTLLRTRAVAFSGYSTADPVLHDTVRNTYEEMAQRADPAATAAKCEEAPAFFFAPAGSKEFHGIEVLRAASRAIGVRHPKLTEHPNYLTFNFPGKPGVADLDESFAWIFHSVFRERQKQAIEAELGSVVSLLLGRPVLPGQLQSVTRAFDTLWEKEMDAAKGWASSPSGRIAFDHTVAWTEHFHPSLLRDMAIAQRIAGQGRPIIGLDELRDGYWYYPANENFGWTAWGAVVELALRRYVAHLCGVPGDWATLSLPLAKGPPRLSPLTNDDMPAVAVTRGAASPLPVRLELSLGRFHRVGTRPSAHALPALTIRWESDLRSLPWKGSTAQDPSARQLWDWAAGTSPQAKPPTSPKEWTDCLRNPS